jgi:hypothetical protein
MSLVLIPEETPMTYASPFEQTRPVASQSEIARFELAQPELTDHAMTRSQQRGIRTETMEVLLTFGTSEVRHGREVVFMDRAGRHRAREVLGKAGYARIERGLDIYLVLSGCGRVLTCAHRTRALKFKH